MSNINLIDYRPELAPYFKQINEEWINAMFTLEAVDQWVLDNPQEAIIDNGGHIYFASNQAGDIVGTCALMQIEPGVYELTKMGVSSHARGGKIGEPLLQQVIQAAQKLPLKTLFLLTNKRCEAAIHLYEKNGFVHDKTIMQLYGSEYERCDVAMRYVAGES